MLVSNDGTVLLMRTAVDGESRGIQNYYKDGDDIRAVPQT